MIKNQPLLTTKGTKFNKENGKKILKKLLENQFCFFDFPGELGVLGGSIIFGCF